MYQVSAAILARVLEEREKERKKEQKFCIDIGTQTHGWHFPDATELLQQVYCGNHKQKNRILSFRRVLESFSHFSLTLLCFNIWASVTCRTWRGEPLLVRLTLTKLFPGKNYMVGEIFSKLVLKKQTMKKVRKRKEGKWNPTATIVRSGRVTCCTTKMGQEGGF